MLIFNSYLIHLNSDLEKKVNEIHSKFILIVNYSFGVARYIPPLIWWNKVLLL